MRGENGIPITPDYVPSGHSCCKWAECWYCEQERPSVPPNVILGES